jgi:hypothetical protein
MLCNINEQISPSYVEHYYNVLPYAGPSVSFSLLLTLRLNILYSYTLILNSCSLISFRKEESRPMTSCFLHICVRSTDPEPDGWFSQNFVWPVCYWRPFNKIFLNSIQSVTAKWRTRVILRWEQLKRLLIQISCMMHNASWKYAPFTMEIVLQKVNMLFDLMAVNKELHERCMWNMVWNCIIHTRQIMYEIMFCYANNTNMATARNFTVISDKFNA